MKKGSGLKVSIGDHILVDSGKKKSWLYKVKGKNEEGGYIAVRKDLPPGSPSVSEIVVSKDLIANLGEDPPYGKAYGVTVEPLRKSDDLKEWGEIRYYRKTTKEDRKAIRKAFGYVLSHDLKKHKLDSLLPIAIEVRHKHGKYDGTYASKGGEEIDTMTLQSELFDYKSLIDLVRHEIFHGVDARLISEHMRVKWLRLYTSYFSGHVAKTNLIAEVKEALRAAGSLRDYKDSLDMENKEEDPLHPSKVLNECLKFIKSSYKLDKKAVDLLLKEEGGLDQYWPKHAFELTTSDDSGFTAYGLKNPKEFLAEAGRLFLSKRAPKRVKKLMEKTLASLI